MESVSALDRIFLRSTEMMNLTRRLAGLLLLLLLILLAGCSDAKPQTADLTWIEPVKLASGETVMIKRHVVMWHERAFGGGFSSAPVYENSRVELSPSTSAFPIWDAPFVPVVFDKDPANGEWIIVASIDGCSLWLRNGLPRPPYWAFRLRNGEWYRDKIPESFLGRATNMFVEFDVTDSSARLNSEIEQRKASQNRNPKHAPQYAMIDAAFNKRCGGEGEPSRPPGQDELDLMHFRNLQ
jgi:hypothetical protein